MDPNVRLSGVIFDLDGTLAESHPMAIQLIGGAISRYAGRDLTPEEVMALFGPNERGIIRAAVGDEHWEEAWETYLADYSARHDLCPAPFSGVHDVLTRLDDCGARLGLVTGKTETTAGISLQVFGIDDLFSGIEGGAMEGIVKAEGIDRIRSAWELPVDEIAYVGDTVMDVREARRAGVMAVAAAWSAFTDAELLASEEPDELFTTVDAFAAWVEPRAC